MSQIFQVQGLISGIKTMSRSLRITFDTLENLSGDAMKRLFELVEQPGWMTINVNQIEAEDIVNLPPVRKCEDNEKTPSQRLRAVLFLLWQKDSMGHETFNNYYDWYMSQLIDRLKNKLD